MREVREDATIRLPFFLFLSAFPFSTFIKGGFQRVWSVVRYKHVNNYNPRSCFPKHNMTSATKMTFPMNYMETH